MTSRKVLGIGLSCIDETIALRRSRAGEIVIEDQRVSLGGMVANALACASKLGAATTIVTAVGDDPEGRFIMRSLQGAGIDTSQSIVVRGGRSAKATVFVDAESGDRWIRPRGSHLPTYEWAIDASIIERSEVVLVDGHILDAAIIAARLARQCAIPVVGDLDLIQMNPHPLHPFCNLLIVNEDVGRVHSAQGNWCEALAELSHENSDLVAITRGASGVDYKHLDTCHHCPAITAQVVDSSGAGDAFHGAFAYGVTQRWTYRQSIDFASAAGVLNCRALGPQSGLPKLEEVYELLRSNAINGPWTMKGSGPEAGV